jgi:uncharacterized protein YbgA (DUF1722 family)
MTTPRESMRLVGDGRQLRMVTVKTGVDHTDLMTDFSRGRVRALATEDLSGYILKKDSPSCGMERVKVYAASGPPAKSGTGLFAAQLRAEFPNLPIEEEGRLCDRRLRENFVERLFAYRRLLDLFSGRWTTGDLVRFHTAHKLVLMAHSVPAYSRLGRMVATAAETPRAVLRTEYSRGFMEALALLATRTRHTNVLQHIAGYFKRTLDADAKAELAALVEGYRLGRQPLIAPVTLIRHHVRRLDVQYLAGQVYLDPEPAELLLRTES